MHSSSILYPKHEDNPPDKTSPIIHGRISNMGNKRLAETAQESTDIQLQRLRRVGKQVLARRRYPEDHSSWDYVMTYMDGLDSLVKRNL
jgi:hypothetical protein